MPWAKATPLPVKQFMHDPIGFMSENLVLVSFHAKTPDEYRQWLGDRKRVGAKGWITYHGHTLQRVTLQLATNVQASRHSVQVPVYNLVPLSGKSGDTFHTYWCPYQQQEDWSITVKDRANYMFTDTMDGCSFAVGSATPDGARMVMHSNRGGDQQAQDVAIRSKMTNIQSILHPEMYRYEMGIGHLKSTTFGVRSGGQWSFYSQSYTVGSPHKLYFRGLKQFT